MVNYKTQEDRTRREVRMNEKTIPYSNGILGGGSHEDKGDDGTLAVYLDEDGPITGQKFE